MEPLLVKKFSAVPGMNLTDIAERLNAETSENRVACVNWPQQYPECPQVSFRIGHAGDELWLGFKVRESRVLGQQTRIHGDVYMDSCVEFFVSFDNKAYYNLEMNCIGTPHMGYGPGQKWQHVCDVPMVWTGDSWEAIVRRMSGSQLNFCFRDNVGNWDNNAGNNWSFAVEEPHL